MPKPKCARCVRESTLHQTPEGEWVCPECLTTSELNVMEARYPGFRRSLNLAAQRASQARLNFTKEEE